MILSGCRIAMALGAVSFKKSLTHASRRCGSVVVWETVTPTCRGVVFNYTTVLNECMQLQGPSNTLHTRAQKLLIASAGKPLLLSAVKVKSRGSSQSLQIGGEKMSQFIILSISLIHLINLHLVIYFHVTGFTCNYPEKKQKNIFFT